MLKLYKDYNGHIIFFVNVEVNSNLKLSTVEVSKESTTKASQGWPQLRWVSNTYVTSTPLCIYLCLHGVSTWPKGVYNFLFTNQKKISISRDIYFPFSFQIFSVSSKSITIFSSTSTFPSIHRFNQYPLLLMKCQSIICLSVGDVGFNTPH